MKSGRVFGFDEVDVKLRAASTHLHACTACGSPRKQLPTARVHALEICGKDLSRERLVTALEGLYEYDTGLMPNITFGPNRRIGALGAYVVTIDPEKKLFPASVEWVAVE